MRVARGGQEGALKASRRRRVRRGGVAGGRLANNWAMGKHAPLLATVQ